MKKVVAEQANENFSLDLKFNDDSVRRFDATPYLELGVFQELKNIGYFKQVRIAYGTVAARARFQPGYVVHRKPTHREPK